MKNVKQNLNLFEHYYNREPSREQLALKIEKAGNSLANFYKLKILELFCGVGLSEFLSVDDLDSFNLDGVRVYAVPDFAVKQERYTVFDWKTGKPSDKDIFQLSFYVLYAQYRWRAGYEDIDIVPVYLSSADCKLAPVKVIHPAEIKNYVTQSVKDMHSVLSDVAKNEADINLCPKTEFTNKCSWCRFQELCK